MAEINVTPLVDVMLVLLIVFMVTAPLLTVGVPVDLPKTEAPPLNRAGGAAGDLGRQDRRHLHPGNRGRRWKPWCRACWRSPRTSRTPRIYVRGDQSINYGRMMEVMGLLTGSGFTKLSLVTEAADKPPAPSRRDPRQLRRVDRHA